MVITPIELAFSLDATTFFVIIILLSFGLISIILSLKMLGIKIGIKRRANASVIAILVIIGIFAILFLIDFFISSFFGYKSFLSYIFSTPIAYFSIIVFAITLVIGCFLPGRLGKIVRILSYIALFIFLLFTEIQIIKPFLKRTEVNLEVCSNFFSPSQTTGNTVNDILTYSSCILTGYVPKNLSSIGWATFFIFYIILPFVFIWVVVYALMKEVFSGWSTIDQFSPLLSFVVAMYGTRVLFGAVLLEFFAYGAWGLAGIFIAVFLVNVLKKIIEDKFKIEEYTSEIKKILEIEKDLRSAFASAAIILVHDALTINNHDREGMLWGVSRLEGMMTIDLWKYLSDAEKNMIKGLILQIRNAAQSGNVDEYMRNVKRLRNILTNWIKKG
jgi:hypothetical protein